MKKFLMMTLLAGLIACVSSDSAFAQKKRKKKRDPEKIFKRLDKNKDGKLSFDEFKGKREGKRLDRAKKQFKKRDKDKDGFLTLKEFKARRKKKKK